MLRALRVCFVATLAVALAACSTADTLQISRPLSSSSGVVPTSSSTKYAAIVVDANNGRVLHAENADIPRYPASLTKMMTVYMLLEAVQQGRISPSSRIPVSAYAASRPPTKLFLKPG